MIQQGQRNLFETIVRFAPPRKRTTIEVDWKNLDGLNYLEGKTLDFVEEQAFQGTLSAHVDGGVPNIVLQTDEVDADTLGELFYFFELSCGISAYMPVSYTHLDVYTSQITACTTPSSAS